VRGAGNSTPSSAEVEERVELNLYSPPGPSWTVLGYTLFTLFYFYAEFHPETFWPLTLQYRLTDVFST